MSPILINTSSNLTSKSNYLEEERDDDTEKAREERKATGRSIAIIIFLSLMCLALYHVIQKKTTILAGVLVPALILFAYTFFVIHISNRDKKKRKKLEAAELELSIPNNETSISDIGKSNYSVNLNSPKPSNTSVSSTSGKQFPRAVLSRQVSSSESLRLSTKPQSSVPRSLKTSNEHLMQASKSSDLKRNRAMPERNPSQVHQLKGNQSTRILIENEVKKLKSSRSFDKSNQTIAHQVKPKQNIKQ